MPTAIYVRISSDPRNMRAGVERQIADCEAIIRQRGWPAPVKYEDNDVSAWSGKRRPAFEQMLLDMAGLDAIVAWDLDRLFRQPRDLERFLDRCEKAGMHKVLTAQGDIDLTSPDGRLRARIMAAVGAKESDDKSRRVKRALQDRREQGKYHGSRPPYGYRFDGEGSIEIDVTAADVVAEAFASILGGGSIRHLVGRFKHLPGAPQTQQSWRSLLLSPTLAGMTADHQTGDWEAIISARSWWHTKKILEAPDRRKHRGTARVHWLKGILWCGKCGGSMSSQSVWHDGVKGRKWVCSKCRGVTVTAEPVEEYLEAALLEAAPTVAAALAPSTGTHPHEVGDGVPLGVLKQRLDDLAVSYARGVITIDQLTAATAEIREQMKPSVAPTPTPTPSAQEWASWTPAQKFDAALGLLGRVTVLPGRTESVGDRLTIEWVR